MQLEGLKVQFKGEDRFFTVGKIIVNINKLAEIAAHYLRKGSQVYIEDSLRTCKAVSPTIQGNPTYKDK